MNFEISNTLFLSYSSSKIINFCYRFPDMFPDVEIVRSIQTELDSVIQEGVANIVQLLRNAETGSGTASTSDTQVKGAASVKLKNNVTGEDKGTGN